MTAFHAASGSTSKAEDAEAAAAFAGLKLASAEEQKSAVQAAAQLKAATKQAAKQKSVEHYEAKLQAVKDKVAALEASDPTAAAQQAAEKKQAKKLRADNKAAWAALQISDPEAAAQQALESKAARKAAARLRAAQPTAADRQAAERTAMLRKASDELEAAQRAARQGAEANLQAADPKFKASLALLRGVVTALGRAMAADASAARMAVDLVAASHSLTAQLGEGVGLRARMLLLLALKHAAQPGEEAAAPAAAAATPSTTPGKGSKASKASKALATPAKVAASAAVDRTAPMAALLQLTMAESSRASSRGVSRDWAAVAASSADASALPLDSLLSAFVSEAHCAKLPALHAALLCQALLTAVQAVPTHSPATSTLTGIATFTALAQLKPITSYTTHLQTWMQRSVPDDQCASFLAALFADAAVAAPVACAALSLLSMRAAVAATCVPHVLAALQRHEPSVRTAAIACMQVQVKALSSAGGAADVVALLQVREAVGHGVVASNHSWQQPQWSLTSQCLPFVICV